MTRLSFEGLRNGRHASITWEDGALFGDPEACAWIEYLARVLEGQPIGPIGGPYSSRDHLQDPYAARADPLNLPRRGVAGGRSAAASRAHGAIQ